MQKMISNLRLWFINLGFKFKFLLVCLGLGVAVGISVEGSEVIRLIKLNDALTNSVNSCKLLPLWEQVLSKGGSVPKGYALETIAVLCDADSLMGSLPPIDLKNPDGSPLSKTYQDEIILQHKIVAFSNEIKRTKGDVGFFMLICLGLGFSLGSLPLAWDFFLKRLAELANAIRGG